MSYEPKPGEPRPGVPEGWWLGRDGSTLYRMGDEVWYGHDPDGWYCGAGLPFPTREEAVAWCDSRRASCGEEPASETVTNTLGGKQSRLPFHPSRFPHAVWLAILAVLEQGAAKYDATPGEQNWRKISAAEHVDHARAHIYLWLDGDRSEPHLIHAICRLAFAAAMTMDEKEKE